MKILIILVLFFCTIQTSLQAQTDYLVTNQNDTIYGKVRHNFAFFGQRIWVKNTHGKSRFKFQDIKAYKQRGRFFEKILFPNKHGDLMALNCRVLSDGKLKLLENNHSDFDEFFLTFKGQTYMINRKFFPNQLWQQLVDCERFKNSYGNYHQSTGGDWIFLPKQRRVWKEIVSYYNQNCN